MKKAKNQTTLQEPKPRPRANKEDGEGAVLANIAAMPGLDRAAEEARIGALVKKAASR